MQSDGFNANLPTEHKSGFEHKPLWLRFWQSVRIRVTIRVKLGLGLYIWLGLWLELTINTTQNPDPRPNPQNSMVWKSSPTVCASRKKDSDSQADSRLRFLIYLGHPITLPMHIVNLMKVYIERNNLHAEWIQYRIFFTLFTFTFAKRWIQCNIGHRMQIKVSNKNHFGSFSDSLGRLAAPSECMASTSNVGNLSVWFQGKEARVPS